MAFARALLKNPSMLLLDEATSSLDTLTERRIQAALASSRAARTTVIVAHRLSTIMDADLIVCFKVRSSPLRHLHPGPHSRKLIVLLCPKPHLYSL